MGSGGIDWRNKGAVTSVSVRSRKYVAKTSKQQPKEEARRLDIKRGLFNLAVVESLASFFRVSLFRGFTVYSN